MLTETESASCPGRRGDTRKQLQLTAMFLIIRTLQLVVCKTMSRVAAALIRVMFHVAVAVPVKSLLGVSKLAFAVINRRCLGYMDQAARGATYTGSLCGDLVVGAMAHSWRVLVQGLTSLVFLCVHADEYVRPPPSPLVLVAHDKPANHPQQVSL